LAYFSGHGFQDTCGTEVAVLKDKYMPQFDSLFSEETTLTKFFELLVASIADLSWRGLLFFGEFQYDGRALLFLIVHHYKSRQELID
jgi:hypothetical protein